MYNFDELIDRRNTNAMNTDGFREYIFHADENMVFPYKDEEFIRMWVADMEFATPDVVIEAMKERLDKRIFGYTRVFDPAYYEAFSKWCQSRYGWYFPKKELVRVVRTPEGSVLVDLTGKCNGHGAICCRGPALF